MTTFSRKNSGIHATHRQNLQKLSFEDLQIYKKTLLKRIDDLKFFNLDLGRQNIRLTQQYRLIRQKAQSRPKTKPSQSYVQKMMGGSILSQSPDSNVQANKLSNTNTVNKDAAVKNSFNFDDLYFMSKKKISNWIPWKKSSTKPNQQSNGNHQQNQNVQKNQINQQQQYMSPQMAMQQGLVPYEDPQRPGYIFYAPPPPLRNQIFPEPTLMPFTSYENSQNDEAILEKPVQKIIRFYPEPEPVKFQQNIVSPEQQQIEYIVRQNVSSKSAYIPQIQPRVLYRQPQRQIPVQGPYVPLYNPKMEQQRIYQQQQQQQLMNTNQNNQPKTNPNRNTFEFNDIPSMGWKKLKGMFQISKKKTSENNRQQPNVQYQRTPTPYKEQQQYYRNNQHDKRRNYSNNTYSNQNQQYQRPVDQKLELAGQRSVQPKRNQRKKIFGEKLEKRMQIPSIEQRAEELMKNEQKLKQQNPDCNKVEGEGEEPQRNIEKKSQCLTDDINETEKLVSSTSKTETEKNTHQEKAQENHKDQHNNTNNSANHDQKAEQVEEKEKN